MVPSLLVILLQIRHGMVLQKSLRHFGKYLSTPTPNIAEPLKQWKKEYEKGNPSVASEESARRYYSVKEFTKSGVENVFKPIHPPTNIIKFVILKINGLYMITNH